MMSFSTANVLKILLKVTRFSGEKKVPILEGGFAWMTAVVFGIRYLVDYCKLRRKLYAVACSAVEKHGTSQQVSDCVLLCPLARTRLELSVTVDQRWELLRQALVAQSSRSTSSTEHEAGERQTITAPQQIQAITKEWSDDDWIQVFQSSLAVRRETSYLVYKLFWTGTEDVKVSMGKSATSLLSKFRTLWPRFLELPQSVVVESTIQGEHARKDSNEYEISLIVPMYRETVANITATLYRAYNRCQDSPRKIQVVVVHVQSSPDDTYNKPCGAQNDGEDSTADSSSSALQQQLILELKHQSSKDDTNTNFDSWGDLKVVTIPFGEGRGRGNTLNIGAKHSIASILTFLHADTVVPMGWDRQIKKALHVDNPAMVFPHACAFTMAIDDSDPAMYTAAGLLGAEWLGVLRCYCGLPYGDSVLSFGRPMFDYMGGYPEQPLMEDYEVMDWLRLRSVVLNTMRAKTTDPVNTNAWNERLVLLSDRAKCSPRRWQKYGVAYTSLINAMCIFRYRANVAAEDLFDFYYHRNGLVSKKLKRV